MNNIKRVPGQVAGVLPKFFFTLASNLVDELQVNGASIVGNIPLAEGKKFNFFEATQFTPEFDQPQDDDAHGEFYSHNFNGYCAGDTPELAADLLLMRGRRFVVLYQDHDGYLRLIGDRYHYLVFDYKFNTGSKPGERKGYKFSFKGKSLNPALFYTGSFEVAEEGTANEPSPISSDGAPVLLKDTHGNLIDTIPAGKTLIISSGFKLTYAII